MKRQEIKLMINRICKKNAYYQFEKNTAVAPPFICFYFPEDAYLFADNRNDVTIGHLVIEIYTAEKDFTLDSKAEQILKSHDLTFTREEMYLKDEKMYMSTYYCDVLIED